MEAALRALRALKSEYLWIDALCINQEDLLERGLQVMRMGLIFFSSASKVLAWIGDEADDSQMAMAYLLSEAQIAMHYNVPIGQKISSVDIPESVTEPFSALFRRPFWKRVWVIQEISKGCEVHVLCSRQSIEWNSFQATIRRLGFMNQPEVIALNSFREGERNKKRPTLHQALSQSKIFLATDDRDKIYGILGLASDGSDLVPAPNYLQPAASVYFQLL